MKEALMELMLFFVVGFVAQLVDGALGMAYGVICMSVLLSMGISPSIASAGIHTAEVVTTGISGFSHAMFENVDYKLFRRLVIPGVIGSITGAYFLTKIPAHIIKPMVAIYLLLMGIIILYKAFQQTHWVESVRRLINRALNREKPSHQIHRLIPLGLAGGFMDAAGGGGWGAIVASTLLAQDDETPRFSVGTTNLAEFFIALSASFTFFVLIGISHWPIVLGLILGGGIAAPLAGFTIRYLPSKVLLFLAGTLVILVSIRTILLLFF